VAVIGESGCGKTVLLKTIIGLVRPSAGVACFDGRNLATLREGELTRERIRFGFVFQQAALFDSLTVAERRLPVAAALPRSRRRRRHAARRRWDCR
jgi:phospholipid/cholesterol/gamma-HCH transport system ATP-binding protein